MEARRARIAPRRVVAWALAAVAVAATAFIADSLRRSVAQLGAAVPMAVQRDVSPMTSPPPPPPPSSRAAEMPPDEAPAASEQVVSSESEPSDSSEPSEAFELQELVPPGPLTGAEFARLVESGALGDVGVDAEAIAEMRRALDAAAFEAELEPSEP